MSTPAHRARHPAPGLACGKPPMNPTKTGTKVKHFARTGLALALGAIGLAAHAVELNEYVSVSGFGTLGLARTNTDQAEFRPTVFPAQGANNHAVNLGVDSKLGLQANARLNPQFSAAVQLLEARGKENEDLSRVSMAFVQWQPTSALSVRAGRLRWGAFFATESLNVGYSNPWVRVPVDVYAQVPMYTIDGIDASYQLNFGDTSLTVQPMFGTTKFGLPAPFPGADRIKGKSKNLVGINLVGENGPWTVRAGYNRTKLTVYNGMTQELFAGLRMADAMLPGAAALADQLEVNDKRGQFMGVGLTYNEGRVLLQTELTRRRTKSFMADTTGWYVTGGYRFGKVMPYVTYAKLKVDSALSNDTLPTTGAMAMLGQGVNMLLSTGNNGQQTTSVGARYDFYKSMAFKLQFDHIRLQGAGSTGFLSNVKPGFDGPVNVVSAVVDFVF